VRKLLLLPLVALHGVLSAVSNLTMKLTDIAT